MVEPRCWRTGVVLIAAGVVLIAAGVVSRRFAAQSPAHSGRAPPCSLCLCGHVDRRVAVLSWGLDSHLFFPSRAVSGQVAVFLRPLRPVLLLVSSSAERSSWHTGVVLVHAGVMFRFLLPTPLHTQVVHTMPRRGSACVQPNNATPPSGLLVVHYVPPHHIGLQVGCNPLTTLWVSRVCMARSLMVGAGGVCTCGVLGDLRCTVAAPLSLVQPTPVLSRVPYLSSTILMVQTVLQGSLRWPEGRGIPFAHQQSSGRASTALHGSLRRGEGRSIPCVHHSQTERMPPEPQRWPAVCRISWGQSWVPQHHQLVLSEPSPAPNHPRHRPTPPNRQRPPTTTITNTTTSTSQAP